MALNEPLWLESVKLAHAAGVPMAAGGDIGNRYPHGTNARELEFLVRAGLSPLEAFHAATSVAARAVKRPALGMLAAGRTADVLVFDGDPLADIRQPAGRRAHRRRAAGRRAGGGKDRRRPAGIAALRVAVVGAGIVGLCVAWHLVRRGAQVTVLEREAPGLGCSYGNSASLSSSSVAPLALPGVVRNAPRMLLDKTGPLHIPAHYWLRAAPWLARFVAASRPAQVERIAGALAELLRPAIEKHRRILEEIEATDLLRSNGQLVVYRDRQQLAQDGAVWSLRRRHGHAIEVIERGEMLDLEPALGAAYSVGVFLPNEAMVANPHRYCERLAQALGERGAPIIRDSVAALEAVDGTVSGARGVQSRYEADAVVVCAGAWSMELLRPLGYRIPLESQRGYHITLQDTGIELHRPVVAADRKVFITSQEAGLRVGGTVELAGLEAPPNAARAELLMDDLRAVFPQARLSGARSNWMGHRPCLPDSLPVIGESERHRGLWFAFGHGHLGLTEAAVTGESVARGVLGEPRELDLRPYSAERFH